MRYSSLLYLLSLFCSVNALANEVRDEIASMTCKIIESETKSFYQGDGKLKNYNWRGTPKIGDAISLVIRKTPGNAISIAFGEPTLSTVRLVHHLYLNDFETDGKNWVTSDVDQLLFTQLQVYRRGLKLYGMKSRNSLDLRYRSGNDWDGIVLGEINSQESNAIQIMAINCKLSFDTWQRTVDTLISFAKKPNLKN